MFLCRLNNVYAASKQCNKTTAQLLVVLQKQFWNLSGRITYLTDYLVKILFFIKIHKDFCAGLCKSENCLRWKYFEESTLIEPSLIYCVLFQRNKKVRLCNNSSKYYSLLYRWIFFSFWWHHQVLLVLGPPLLSDRNCFSKSNLKNFEKQLSYSHTTENS